MRGQADGKRLGRVAKRSQARTPIVPCSCLSCAERLLYDPGISNFLEFFFLTSDTWQRIGLNLDPLYTRRQRPL